MAQTNSILYYSSFCKHSDSIVQYIGHSQIKNDIHFLNIDNRFTMNGNIYVKYNEKHDVPLPKQIDQVPSMLVVNNLTNEQQILIGNEIKEYIFNLHKEYSNRATMFEGEPEPYAFDNYGFVVSDHFSFLDQTPDELAAKGDGGIRQMHNYASLSLDGFIETPSDDINDIGKDNLKNLNLDALIAKRNSDIKL